MNKNVLILACLLCASGLFAQDTITGFTFPVNSGGDSLNANLGLPGNLGYDIRYEGVDTAYNTIYFIDGTEDYAAAATGWDNGADEKFWSIKFKAENFTDFHVNSLQYSDPANPGPANFKLQWRLSSGTWADVSNGTVTVGTDWTTGSVNQLPVPITGQGTSSIYIRWIMTSNLNTSGNPVEAHGVSAIDNILVTALNNTGVNEVIYTNQITLFPNPNQGRFTLSTRVPLSNIRVYDLKGSLLYENLKPSLTNAISLELPAGIYLVSAHVNGSDATWSARMIVQ